MDCYFLQLQSIWEKPALSPTCVFAFATPTPSRRFFMEQSTSFVNNFSFASSLGTVLLRNGIKNTAQKHGISAMPKK